MAFTSTAPVSTTTPPSHRNLRIAVLGGLGLAGLLTLVALARYPGSARQLPMTILFAGGASGMLIVLAAWVALRATRPKSHEGSWALSLGSGTGLLCGALWVVEIGFNNLLPPEISVPHRDALDDIFWLVIVLVILAAAITGSLRARRFTPGVVVGVWSGLLSGLLACLAGLSLVVWRIDLLLRDPLAQVEYAERGASSGAPDMATYFARDTMAGAFGHLVLLGLIMGLLLGVLGGGIGRFIVMRDDGTHRTV